MNRTILPTLLASVALAAPAQALAAPAAKHRALHSTTVTGVLLASPSASHAIRVVTAKSAVHVFHLTGRVPHGATRGARVSFLATGSLARNLKVLAHVRKLSFLARVVRSASGTLVVSTGDGAKVKLSVPKASHKHASSHRHSAHPHGHAKVHHSLDIPVSVQGLAPGQTILITISLSPAGDELSIAIKLVDATTGTGATGAPATDSTLSGTVVDASDDGSTFTVEDSAGNDTALTLSDALLASSDQTPNICDIVSVSYHADPADPSNLVADAITTTGTDTTSSACSDTSGDSEVIGPITALDPVAGTVTITGQDGAPVTLSADPSDLSGLNVGDQVDALYSTADDGSLVLDAIGAADSSGDQGGDPGTDPGTGGGQPADTGGQPTDPSGGTGDGGSTPPAPPATTIVPQLPGFHAPGSRS